MEYKYRAIDSNGEIIEDIYIAKNKKEVLDMIKSKEYLALSIKENLQIDFKTLLWNRKVEKKDLVVFCRLFFKMLEAGINISKALEILAGNITNSKLKSAVFNVNDHIHKGLSLSDALERESNVFPIMFVEMVRAGEISGNLEEIIQRLGDYYHNQYKIDSKIKSSLLYPALLIVLSITVIVFMLTFVLPVFYGIFENRELVLPLPTRILIQTSDIIRNHWREIIILTITIFVSVRRYFRTSNGRMIIDYMRLNVPFVKKIYIKIATANFTKTLSILLSSGIPLIKSLVMASNVINNIVIKSKLENEIMCIEEGKSISESIKDFKIFPTMLVSMIEVGEETGALDVMLLKTSELFDEEVRTSLERFAKLIEPLLMIVVGFIIGFIVISLALPLFDIMYAI